MKEEAGQTLAALRVKLQETERVLKAIGDVLQIDIEVPQDVLAHVLYLKEEAEKRRAEVEA